MKKKEYEYHKKIAFIGVFGVMFAALIAGFFSYINNKSDVDGKRVNQFLGSNNTNVFLESGATYNNDSINETVFAELSKIINIQNDRLLESKQLIVDLQNTVEFLKKVSSQGGELAVQANKILKSVDNGINDVALLKNIDLLIEKYELNQLRPIIGLYLGRAALSFYVDTWEAKKAYQRVLELSPQNYRALNGLGNIYMRLGELPKAIKLYEKALKTVSSGSQLNEAIVYGNLGEVYKVKGEFNKAIEYYQQSLYYSQKSKDKVGIALNYISLGIIYRKQDVKKAIEYHMLAVSIFRQLNDRRGLAYSYGSLGIVYRTQGELDAAIKLYQQSLRFSRELDDKLSIANNYGNLGNIYREKKDLIKALEFIEISLQLNLELENKGGLANNYNNLGLVYYAQYELTKAVEYFEKALKLNQELSRKEEIASNYGNLGNVYRVQHKYDKAFWYFEQSLKINKELQKKAGLANDYLFLGVMQSDIHSARDMLTKSLKLYQEMNMPQQSIAKNYLESLDKLKQH